jgi:putative hemolysin
LQHRAKNQDTAAIKLSRLLAHPERLLITILLVTNFMNISAIILMTEKVVNHFGPFGYPISALLFLPIYVFFLELLPKSLFRRFPYRALAPFSEILRLTDAVLSPVLGLGDRLAALILGERSQRKLFGGREDFKYFTTETERSGTLSPLERQMIHSVVDFSAIQVREVMIDLGEVPQIAANAAIEELIALSQSSGRDLLAVTEPNAGIVGLIEVFEVLVDRVPGRTVNSYRRRILSVKADEHASAVIGKLRAARSRLAIVTDAAGQPIGAVNLDDLVQRLVNTAAPVA